ncbi:MAG: cytochrome c family protein [Pseudomonadota bacterium]|nr:cytochrome c family protein [Pseudomonadota bacterium]
MKRQTVQKAALLAQLFQERSMVRASLWLAMAATMTMIGVLLSSSIAFASDDVQRGEKLFTRCQACHSLVQGVNKSGPSLFGIADRPSAAVEGYRYSKAMEGAGVVWNDENLKSFLASPRKFIPGVKMSFAIRKQEELDDLVAFLRAQSHE